MPEQIQCVVPVLVIVRDHLRPPAATIDAMRKVRPEQVYVAAINDLDDTDGTSPAKLLAQFRDCVDWPCDLKIRIFTDVSEPIYRTCKAISWFFESSDRGIVVDEKSAPSPAFFAFCETGLATYADMPKVWHINGCNYGAPQHLFGEEPVAFAPVADTTCWATWQDRWHSFSANPFIVADLATRSNVEWPLSFFARRNLMRAIRNLESGTGSWATLWQATILNESGLALCPRNNLADPSNGSRALPFEQPALEACSPRNMPATNRDLTRWYESKRGLRNWLSALIYSIATRVDKIRLVGNHILSRILFGPISAPVVIASNGRSGSTMLCDSVAETLVKKRFGPTIALLFGGILREAAIEFAPRLRHIPGLHSPIIKTHDRPEDSGQLCGKFVFIFGDPLEATLSAHLKAERDGYEWLQEHLYHLRSEGDADDLLESDVLKFKDQCRAWSAAPQASVLLIPFDELWERQSEISQFLGFRIDLPERRARRPKPSLPNINHDVFNELSDEYRHMCEAARERLESLHQS